LKHVQAGIAAASNIEMSSHLMPELSVHLLAATSTAHWIKYMSSSEALHRGLTKACFRRLGLPPIALLVKA